MLPSNNYIEITTHKGEDTDKMCAFLNSYRIGYSIAECHHFIGFTLFPDNPHYTNQFHIHGYAKNKMEWIQTLLKESCKHITFHFLPVNLVEKEENGSI